MKNIVIILVALFVFGFVSVHKAEAKIYTPSYKSYAPSYKSYTPSYKSYTPTYKIYTPSYNSYTPSYKSYTPGYKSYTPITSVGSYFKSNGTFVSSYFRTKSDGFKWNNFSSWGNYNPFTGKKGYTKWW